MKSIESIKHRHNLETTIAEFNKVSIKAPKKQINCTAPFRISLPDYFNIPCFEEKSILHKKEVEGEHPKLKQDVMLKKRIKDMMVLAEGMKRAKSTKEQSRFYFTLGVLLHNNSQYTKSIEYLQKFLRMVIIMGDQKSTQLGLNVIGCQYMYLGDFQRAMEFHQRQANTSLNPDRFISFANIGFCQELLGNNKEAYSSYQKLRNELDTMEGEEVNLEERQKLAQSLIERAQKKILEDDIFMTQKVELSPKKSIKSSFIKEESSLLMKKSSPNAKEYDSAKFNYAISTAEENIDQYLKSTFKS